MNQPTLFPPPGSTQRWRNRNQSWRPTSEGGFDPAEYDVDIADKRLIKPFITQHHYSSSFPAARVCYSLYHHADLVGAGVLSVPTNHATLSRPFPGRDHKHLAELGRFALLDQVPAPAESWTIARILELASREAGIHGIVAFSDPTPRTRLTDGAVIFPGHIGHIYKCANALYTGRTTPRRKILLPDGTTLEARTIQKITRQEQGHQYAERILTSFGATPRDAATPNRAWLQQALAQIGARTLHHTGNHRYLFLSKSKRRYWHIGIPTLPHPQQELHNA